MHIWKKGDRFKFNGSIYEFHRIDQEGKIVGKNVKASRNQPDECALFEDSLDEILPVGLEEE